MKKSLILLFVAAGTVGTAGHAAAQEWKELLTKIATETADQLTDGKLTEKALTGTWNYTQPGVRFEGEDLLAGATGTALESTVAKRLETAYHYAGIRAGSCVFTFNDDETFCATVGKHQLSGTYAFDASTHIVTLRFAKGKINLGTMEGHAYLDGRALQLVFPVTKLIDMVSTLGSKISSLSTVTTMLEKYKNVYIGFAFQK